MKRIISKLKYYWKKLKEKIFGKPATREEIFDSIFEHVKNNKPHIMSEHCICGNVLTIYDVEKHYAKNYVHVLYYCKKCNCTTERRYSYLMELLKD